MLTEAELRNRLEREVSAPNKELLWMWLKQDHYVAEVCRGESGWGEFKDAAIRLADRQRETLGQTKPPGRTHKPLHVAVELTELEMAHSAALAPYLSKRAALLPGVRNFRGDKLGGDVLEPEEVTAFLRSELEFLSTEEYADLRWSLEVDPPDPGGEEEELKDLVGGWENRSRASLADYETQVFHRMLAEDTMAIPTEPDDPYVHGLMHLIRDESGKTLEELVRWLGTIFPWPLRDAAWYVITDEPPEVEALKVRYRGANGTHTIAFAPWISEKSIRLAYRSLQSKDNRPLSTKSLIAFRFVNEETEPGNTPKWAELTRRWNDEHPKDQFVDRSALRRAYERAEQRLASPWRTSVGLLSEQDG